MTEAKNFTLQPPRFEQGRTLLVAGFGGHFRPETVAEIPKLWDRLLPQLGQIPGQVGRVCYGVCCNADDIGNFDYIAGVEVGDFGRLPAELVRARLPASEYAAFAFAGPLSAVSAAFHTIFAEWAPSSGRQLAEAPWVERYAEDFDPATGRGLEIWMPLKP
jgi:AraC family transcriptional regulator